MSSGRRNSKGGAPKKGKKGQNDADKAMRDEELRYMEMLTQLEKEGEQRQASENELRDQLEIKEAKRMKKEAQIALLMEKDTALLTLTTQMNDMSRTFSAERAELEDELRRMLQMKDSLLNELSQTRTDFEQTVQTYNIERSNSQRSLDNLTAQNTSLTKEVATLKAQIFEKESTLTSQLTRHTTEVAHLRTTGEQMEKDLRAKVTVLERELERATALTKTLQEVIETREADDRKNVVLMQLLNNQLDENKRRSTEVMEEERNRSHKLLQDLQEAELKVKHLTEENNLHKKEKDDIRRQAEESLLDYKGKLDQVKFDVKFLHSELNIYKSKLTKQTSDTESKVKELSAANQKTYSDLTLANERIQELENLLRTRDREHFDKVTFLNAQISNNRSIITNLQTRLSKDKETHDQEISSLQEEMRSRRAKMDSLQNDLDRQKLGSTEVEGRLAADVAVLKTTVFQLQSTLIEKEREYDVMVAQKDEDMAKLKRKLDEHFIPYRKELSSGDASSTTTLESILNDKVSKLGRDLEVRMKAAAETEARLKAQMANQNHIIESLQLELNAVRDESSDKVSTLQRENERLKRTLETGNMRIGT
eukprot:PhF_6_TR25634/c0_g1_i1/m.36040